MMEKSCDSQLDIQKKTFTRWCNKHLQSKFVVEDLCSDFSDGAKLLILLEILSQRKPGSYYNESVGDFAQKVNNVQLALLFITDVERIKLVSNLDVYCIAKGSLDHILELIWSLILHYQVSAMLGSESQEGLSPEQALLCYINKKLTTKKVTNFTQDWNDGTVIAALVDAMSPGLCPNYATMIPENALENATCAMKLAENSLGISQLLDPEDMVSQFVDGRSMITYLSQFLNAKYTSEPVCETEQLVTKGSIANMQGSSVKENDLDDMSSAFHKNVKITITPNAVEDGAETAKENKQDEDQSDTSPEPWMAFLPFICERMTGPLFRCFLKRAASILSTVDFSLPSLPLLRDNVSGINTAFKLFNVSIGLIKMYENARDEDQKKLFLGIVAEEQAFVYFAIELVCKLFEGFDSVSPVLLCWQKSTEYFLGLVMWTLEICDDLKVQLGRQGSLVKIIKHIQQLPVKLIEKLSEENVMTQIIWLSVQILFQCAVYNEALQTYFIKQKTEEALHLLLHSSDAEIRLLTRAFLVCVSSANASCISLQEDEVYKLVEWLNTDLLVPFSFHYVSFQVLFTMMKYLIKSAENAALFELCGIHVLLSQLSDRLTNENELKLLEALKHSLDDNIDPNISSAALEKTCLDVPHEYSPEKILETVLPAEAAAEITELLLKYLIQTILPYEGIPMEDGLKQLSEATWFTVSECILLLSLIMEESEGIATDSIIFTATQLSQACKAMLLAVQMGSIISDEEVPKLVMKPTFHHCVKICITWSDQSSELAQAIAQSGFVQFFTGYLQDGLYANPILKETIPWILGALTVLLNISYDPSNYPAFFFADTIREVISYVGVSDSTISSTAKFTLSCLHQHLDCEQLLILKLEEKDAQYCVQTLNDAMNSDDFKADGFAAHELFKIVSNLTHPSISSRPLPKSQKTSVYDEKMLVAAEMLSRNCSILFQCGVISTIKHAFKQANYHSLACKLLWNFLHQDKLRDKILLEYPEIIESVSTCSVLDQYLSDSCLWLLGKASEEDMEAKLKYAEGCYKLEFYAEAVTLCSNIFENSSDKQLCSRAKLLKGKAMFYDYQRKIMYLMEKKFLNKEEEKKLINECFKSIKEAVSLLGIALDELYLDEEGSKLLDWAMMDCIRETNQLNLCKRCLLCRQHSESLRKSHIFSKFQLYQVETEGKKLQKEEKKIIFGQNKHLVKSAGECWFWMCCERCEGIMTQNAENQFSQLFPSTGTVEYSTWLFNYCCTILFRTLSCVKFPRTFNDNEVYGAFLSCRKHLLSLPVKGKHEKRLEIERFNLQLISQSIEKEVEPFLFVSPKNLIFGLESVQEQNLVYCFFPWLAPHRLVDGYMDLAGCSHFFVVYCNGTIILLQFGPSIQYNLPSKCKIFPQGGTFSIPDSSERMIELIPKGVWMLQQRSVLKSLQDLTEVLQQLSPHGAENLLKKGSFKLPEVKFDELNSDAMSTKNNTSQHDEPPKVTLRQSSNRPQLSMLPPDFKIVKPLPHSLIDRFVNLPKGHQIMLHLFEESCGFTVFLVMDESGQPYVLYLVDSNKTARMIVDGAYIGEIDGEICFLSFLSEHSLYAGMRDQLKVIQETVQAMLIPLLYKHGFYSLEMFLHYFKCRLSSRCLDEVISLGLKCSFEGCWYCKCLCHCCLKPVSSINTEEYRFCSKKCTTFFCADPALLPNSIVAIDRREELLKGNFKGPSILDIIKVSNDDESSSNKNKIEFLSLCLGDDSSQLGKLYILWQIRSIHSQYFVNFSITEECVPLEILWPQYSDQKNLSALQEACQKLQPVLYSLIKKSVLALGCECIADYLVTFL